MAVTTSARFWKDCSTSEQMQRRYLKMGVSAVFTIGFIMFLVFLTCIFVSSVILLSAFFSRVSLCSSEQAMESPTSSVSTAASFGEYFAHNMWNPLLELLFLEQTSGVIVLYVEEIELAKIALSCHFALVLLCYKDGDHDSAWTLHWAPLPVECIYYGTVLNT